MMKTIVELFKKNNEEMSAVLPQRRLIEINLILMQNPMTTMMIQVHHLQVPINKVMQKIMKQKMVSSHLKSLVKILHQQHNLIRHHPQKQQLQ
jgi:hypothetical protein